MSEDKKKKKSAYASLTGFHRAVPIILIAIALFIALCFITKNTGKVGIAISEFLLGSFSIGGYFIPVVLALHALFYSSDIKKKRLISRIIFSVILLLCVCAFAHTIYSYGEEPLFSADEFYSKGLSVKGGGVVGGAISFAVVSVIGYVGMIILALTVFALYVTYFFSGENNVIKNGFMNLLYVIVNGCAKIEKRIKARKQARKDKKEKKERDQEQRQLERRASALMERESELYDDEFFAVDNGMSEFRIAELGINESRRPEDIERNPTLHERVHPRSAVNAEPVSEAQYTETSSEPEDAVTEQTSDADPSRPRRQLNTDYGIGDSNEIIIESQPSETARTVSNQYSSDSADSVFAGEFNPYSLEENERLANKPSSRSGYVRDENTVSEIREPENRSRVFSEREIEEARRRASFEMRREAVITENDPYAESAASEPTVITEEPIYEARANASSSAPVAGMTVSESTVITEDFSQSTVEDIYTPPSEVTQNPPEVTSSVSALETERPTFSDPIPYVSDRESDKTQTLRISREPMTEDYPSSEPEENDDNTMCVFSEETVTEPRETADSTSENGSSSSSEPVSVFEFDSDDDDDDSEDAVEGEIPPENQNPDILKYRSIYSIFGEPESSRRNEENTNTDKPSEPDVTSSYESAESIDDEDDEEDTIDGYSDENDDDADEEDSVPFEPTSVAAEPMPVPQPTKPESEKPKGPDYSNFKFPPLDILAKGTDTDDPSIEAEIQENGEKLIDALAQFNVRASVRSVDRGPRITRYEIVPARGVRVNSVISLFDDIALNLAAEGIRMEAPIPGKSAIGVEIPNKHSTNVLLRDLLETEEFRNESSKTFSCIGKDVTGNPVFGDMSKMPHILVAGATGMGKSVCINSILISILYKARPDEVKLIMIDPKTVEFTMYNGIPHLLVPVVTDVKQAAGALMWAIDEMNRRYELMAKHEVRKLDSYNEIVKADPSLGEPLPKIIIVIDELNDLMQQVRKPVEGLITNITQKARAAGIHMIIGTQRPSVDVITGVIKANVPSRISCKVTSFNDSKTILDQAGAEKLLDKGDMLYAPVGKPKPIRVQGAFVSDGEVEKIMKFLKSNVKGNIYDEKAMEDMSRAAQKCSKGKDSGFDDDFDTDSSAEEGSGYLNDKQFLEAVDLAIKQGKISTSLIQRKLSIGYGKAAKFIDIMEELGIVSEPNGQKPRDVLVSRDEWREMLSRRSLDD